MANPELVGLTFRSPRSHELVCLGRLVVTSGAFGSNFNAQAAVLTGYPTKTQDLDANRQAALLEVTFGADRRDTWVRNGDTPILVRGGVPSVFCRSSIIPSDQGRERYHAGGRVARAAFVDEHALNSGAADVRRAPSPPSLNPSVAEWRSRLTRPLPRHDSDAYAPLSWPVYRSNPDDAVTEATSRIFRAYDMVCMTVADDGETGGAWLPRIDTQEIEEQLRVGLAGYAALVCTISDTRVRGRDVVLKS